MSALLPLAIISILLGNKVKVVEMNRRLAEIFNKTAAPENTHFYLAAAISDFYIPRTKMSEHKIQSKEYKDTGIKIELDNVPKILYSFLQMSYCLVVT
jgi:hypothetical protein